MSSNKVFNYSLLAALLALAAIPGTAFAYVGPGAGISALGALWGLILGVVTALGIVLFWPIRMMLRKRKAAKEAKLEESESPETASARTANSGNNTGNSTGDNSEQKSS